MNIPKWAIFLAGLALGLVPGIWQVHKLNDELRVTVDSTSREIAELRVEVKKQSDLASDESDLRDEDEADRQASEAEKSHTHTVIVDITAPYSAGTRINFLNMSNQGGFPSDGGYLRMGRALVLPGRIVPQSTDGDLGYLYGYIQPNGKMDGWYTMERAQ